MGRPDSQPTVVHVELPRRGSSLGIASIVLGVLAFLICWIPFLGAIGIPLSTLGLILGVLGILVSFFRKGASIGMPLAGTIICGIAIFVAGSMTSVLVGTIKSVHDVNQRIQQDANATNQQPMSATTTQPSPAAFGGSTPAIPPSPTSAPTASNPSVAPENAPPAEPPVTWAPATQAVRQGDIKLRITSVRVGLVPLTDVMNGAAESTDPDVMITIELTNLSTTKKLDYHTFAGNQFSMESSSTLKDNFDNNYKSVFFSTDRIIGRVESDSIYPGKSLSDVLVFERPLDNVSYLNLELPATSFGGTGMIRLRIPKSMILFDKSAAK
jgi:hypothetical protein